MTKKPKRAERESGKDARVQVMRSIPEEHGKGSATQMLWRCNQEIAIKVQYVIISDSGEKKRKYREGRTEEELRSKPFRHSTAGNKVRQEEFLIDKREGPQILYSAADSRQQHIGGQMNNC